MKKLFTHLFLLSSALAASSSYAYTHVNLSPTIGSGFYIGGGLGIDELSIVPDTDFIYNRSPILGQHYLTTNYSNGDMNAMGQLFAGYGYRCNNYYLGGEGFLNFSNATYSITSKNLKGETFGTATSYYYNQWLKNTWGFRIRPGYFISNGTLLYVPIGLVWSQLQSSTDANFNLHNVSKNLFGGQIGIGLEQALRNNLSLRLEYLYTRYENFSINTLSLPNPTSYRFRHYQVNNDQAVISLAYNFGCPVQAIRPLSACFGKGFYIGAEGGRSTLLSQATTRNNDLPNNPNVDNTSPVTLSEEFRGMGGFGRLFAGYGKTFCCNYYLGGELFGDLQSSQITIKDRTYPPFLILSGTPNNKTINIDITNSIGAAFIPGLFIADNTMLYGRIGAVSSYYQENFSQQNYPNRSIDRRIWGLQLGVGLETSLCNNFSMRLQYTGTNYENVKWSIVQAPIDPTVNPFGINNTEKQQTFVSQFSLGLIYNFNV